MLHIYAYIYINIINIELIFGLNANIYLRKNPE